MSISEISKSYCKELRDSSHVNRRMHPLERLPIVFSTLEGLPNIFEFDDIRPHM